jgi:apolipoprotein N-acyltransferase
LDHPLNGAGTPASPGPQPAPKAGARSRRLWLAALALASGGLWALAFVEAPNPLVAVLGLVPLFLLCDHTRPRDPGGLRPTALGFLHGWGFWFASMPWIVHTLTAHGEIAWPVACLLLALLAAYLGAYTALFVGLGARLWQTARPDALGRAGRPWLAMVGLPALWVTVEWMRGTLLAAFPWNLAAHAWIGVPGTLPLSAWIGAWGVSFVVVLVAVALTLAVRERRPLLAVGSVLAVALALGVAARFASGQPAGSDAVPSGSQAHPVRVIQPNIPNQVGFDPELAIASLERLFAQSRAACDVPGALIVWPESAAWPYIYGDDPYLDVAVRDLATRGCTVILNAPRQEGPRFLNAALLVDAQGLRAVAGKRHLVPFGEYVPFAKAFPWIGRLARSAGDFSPATEITLLPWGDQRLGAAICYEVVFPGETADLVAAGATMLVTVVNDAWYGDTAAPWQHLAAARFRAAENRRPLLRAAITGVSAVVAPDGRLWGKVGVGQQGTIRANVAGRTDRSPFSRAPWAVPALSGALAVLALFSARRPAAGQRAT